MMDTETENLYNKYIITDSKLQELSKKTMNKKQQVEYEELKKQYYQLKKELNNRGIVIGNIRKW